MGVKSVQDLQDIANKLRIHSIRATNASNSGHPTSCCSIAEIMSVLFFNEMKYKVQHPKDPSSDRFVLSKGHAAPILYAAWVEAGLISEAELMQLRKLESDLEGHPTPRLNFVDVATGSLGQGLSVAAGMAYTGKYFEKAEYRVYCLIGDGESAEGSIWEALSFAGKYKLDNLVAIFDINRLGQSEATMFQHDMELYHKRLESFGFHAVVIDGHNIEEIVKTFGSAKSAKGKPTAILARTYKGKGLTDIEDKDNWHGKPLGAKAEDAVKKFLSSLANNLPPPQKVQEPTSQVAALDESPIRLSEPPNYKLGEKVATRLAYGTALVKLGASNRRIIALDGDTKNSTFADKFRNAYPDRFIECFIAEQNMIGVALGCSTRGRTIPFASAFATFFTRAFDQLRMAVISQGNIKCCGSHCGVSIGEDGPSQMGLEDIAMFRSLPDSTVFYPADAVSTERAVELAALTQGICFIRTSRPATTVIYANDEPFAVGKAKVVKKSGKDSVLVIGAGVTIDEALKASKTLQEQHGISIRVLDPFTIKPLDVQTIRSNALECGGRILTVEDHYYEGGLGEAVSSSLSLCRDIVVSRVAVGAVPRSGTPEQLLEMFGLSASCIVKKVLEIKDL